MPVNFFNKACAQTTNAQTFGLCDDGLRLPLCCDVTSSRPAACSALNNLPAYINFANSNNWIATILNPDAKEVTFVPIDNCEVVLSPNSITNKQSTCDGALLFENTLFFIELKDQRSGWKADALAQLESTIKIFNANYPNTIYTRKKICACNKQHSRPHFEESDRDIRDHFFAKYKFRVHFQAEIII
jgi:hypothetical protein